MSSEPQPLTKEEWRRLREYAWVCCDSGTAYDANEICDDLFRDHELLPRLLATIDRRDELLRFLWCNGMSVGCRLMFMENDSIQAREILTILKPETTDET